MKKILKYTGLLMIVISFMSCNDFLDVNDDPNNPVTVTPDLVLPTAQVYSANIIQGNTGRRANCLGNMLMYNWSQSDGYSWYTDEFKYNVTSSFYQNIFNDSYSTALKQYQILDQLEDERYYNYKAIAKVMKAFHFQLLVDLYGDVPYTEALLRSNEATPVYDDAQTIYEDLISELDTAIFLINNSTSTSIVPGADDVIFEGDMTDWKKFANTMKLRILVRQSSMSGRESYITAEFGKIASEGSGYITADVGVNPGYVKEEDKQSPFWNYFGWDASGTITMDNNATCATDYVLEYLTTTTDPRIDYLYEEPSTGHLGVKQG
ncbi:MAG: SusD/RagB family nutrient-binding outer membrane lipoprotein, partial [Draconibacterium sp.]